MSVKATTCRGIGKASREGGRAHPWCLSSAFSGPPSLSESPFFSHQNSCYEANNVLSDQVVIFPRCFILLRQYFSKVNSYTGSICNFGTCYNCDFLDMISGRTTLGAQPSNLFEKSFKKHRCTWKVEHLSRKEFLKSPEVARIQICFLLASHPARH